MEGAETGEVRTVNQAKCKAERKRFGNMRPDDQKCDVLRFQSRWSKLIRVLLAIIT